MTDNHTPDLQDDTINPTSVLQNNLDSSFELQNGLPVEMQVSASLTDTGNNDVTYSSSNLYEQGTCPWRLSPAFKMQMAFL